MLRINCSLTAQMFNKEALQAVRTLRSKNALDQFQTHSIERVPRTTPSVSIFFESDRSGTTKQALSKRSFSSRAAIFIKTRFCFQSLTFRGEALNLQLSGANRLNNSQDNIRKVYCLDAPPSSS